MSETLLQLVNSGKTDELCRILDPTNIIEPCFGIKDLESMYMDAEWSEETLTKVVSLRLDFEEEVPMIIGISSKLGFMDIIRILVYRVGVEPEGRYLTFDSKYHLSALEAAIVYGRLDSIDLLVQCGTTNKWGEASNLTLFEFAYMSRQLSSLKRLVFWSEKLSTGVCSGDSWVRVNFRMLMGMDREMLRIFSESSDSETIRRNTEKEIRLYILNFLENAIFTKSSTGENHVIDKN